MRPPVNRASRKDHGGRQGCHCPHVACAFVLLIAVQLALAPAYAQNSLLTQARAHMADGNPQAAYEVLTPHESSLAGDPGFDYLLGIAAMDSGHLTHSVFALERVLAVQPDNVLARAEIARVYLMLGELRTSRQEFEAVGCTTFVEGFFAGNDGSHAGLAYKTQIPGDYINGAAAFKKD